MTPFARLVTGPPGHLDRGGRAAHVRPPHREAAARRRRAAHPRPHHQEGHPRGAPAPVLEQGRARAGSSWARRSARAATSWSARPSSLGAGADVLLIDIAHAHSEVMRRAVEAVRARFGGRRARVRERRHGRGRRVPAGSRRGRDQGRDGAGARLPDAARDRRAGVPQLQAIREAWCAVGDEVPIIADGGVRDDKDMFLALVCGRLRRDAREHAVGHRRGAGPR